MSTTTNPIHTMSIATRDCSAQAILDQIGVMSLLRIGAKEIVNLGHGIMFRSGSKRGHKVIIVLAANDTYTVELVRVRKFDAESVEVHEGVYCDQLTTVVETMLGERS